MRLNYVLSVLGMVSTIALAGAGCAPKTSTADACGNPYYPFKEGMAIAYSVSPSTGAVGDSDYTLRTVSVKGTEATLRAELPGGASAEMTADCSSGSVALKGSSNLSSAIEGAQFKTTVLSSEGTYMPANVSAGTTWNNSETVQMDMTGGAAAGLGSITLTTKENSKAIAEESVTVPAGTYKAIKVELTRETTSKTSSGFAIPASKATSTEWWVKGVGLVKSITKADGQTSTVEAKSVTGL
ncbi:MAG: hypothetical protein WC802_00485 [Patescibacteria group bacterium]|jgi:hypothetical protein